MSYTVYILLCKDDSYYTGITNDMDRRLWEHQSGYNVDCYTFKRRPLKLVFQHHFDQPESAITFEKKIKKWRREKKEALINNEWEKLPELSRSYQNRVNN